MYNKMLKAARMFGIHELRDIGTLNGSPNFMKTKFHSQAIVDFYKKRLRGGASMK